MQGKQLTEHELRQEMVRVGRLIWERGYVAATDGNLSARLGTDRLLVTASGLSKGFLSPDDLIMLDLEGQAIPSYRGRGQKASSEVLMHLQVYRQRPDVNAVVHAHPPLAIAFSIAGVSLARCVIPEVIVTLGSILTTGYATPGTGEVSEIIQQAVRDHDAIILAHHGSITVGKSLWEAYLRLEKVEHTAEITLAAHELGRVRTLSPEAVEKLTEKRRQLLQAEGRELCEDCSVCLLGDANSGPSGAQGDLQSLQAGAPVDETFIRQIAQSVLRAIQDT
jgi:L-fuculose-phosphate aldolase